VKRYRVRLRLSFKVWALDPEHAVALTMAEAFGRWWRMRRPGLVDTVGVSIEELS
jgi:hypothetical protein